MAVSKDIVSIVSLIAILVCLFFAFSKLAYEVRITNEEINHRLAEKFPLTKTYLMLSRVTLSNSHVILHDNTNRVTLGIDFEAEIPSHKKRDFRKGTLTVTCGIQYNNKTGQFYLTDFVVDTLSVSGLEKTKTPLITGLVSSALNEYLARIPVYTLQATDIKKAIARLIIKNVRISNGVILVTLGG